MDGLSLYELHKICRICLKADILVSIYSPTFLIRPVEMLTKLQMLKYSLDDNLPRALCQACLYRLVDAYQLQQLAETSEQHLHDYLDLTNNQNNMANSLCKNSNLEGLTSQSIVPLNIAIQNEMLLDNKIIEVGNDSNANIYKNICDILEHNDVPANDIIEVVGCGGDVDLLNDVEIDVSSLTRSDADMGDNDTLSDAFDINKNANNILDLSSINNLPNNHNMDFGNLTSDMCQLKTQTNNIIEKQLKTTRIGKRITEQCNECGKIFHYRGYLEIHKRTHTGEKPYKCETCSRQFIQLCKLRLHERTHHKDTNDKSTRRYQCEICAALFTTSSNLKAHGITHLDERNFHCSICDRSFKSCRDLKRHEPIHKTNKDVTCTLCERTFTKHSYLNIHMMTVHRGLRRHKCGECYKLFSNRSNLTSHMRTHTGEKPFQCHFCPWKFNQSSVLIRHLKIHSNSKPVDKQIYHNTTQNYCHRYQDNYNGHN